MTTATATMTAPQAPPTLDRIALWLLLLFVASLRGLSVLAILVVHFKDIEVPATFAERAFVWYSHVCLAGLDIFFIVSGFLITGILFDAKDNLDVAPHWALFAGGAIFLTVLSINFVGDGLRDALDPRRVL